jgi:hypothetical protein
MKYDEPEHGEFYLNEALKLENTRVTFHGHEPYLPYGSQGTVTQVIYNEKVGYDLVITWDCLPFPRMAYTKAQFYAVTQQSALEHIKPYSLTLQ